MLTVEMLNMIKHCRLLKKEKKKTTKKHHKQQNVDFEITTQMLYVELSSWCSLYKVFNHFICIYN